MLFQEIFKIIVLFLVEIISLVVSLKKTKFNFTHPGVCLEFFLLIGTVFYILGYHLWDNTLKLNTLLVLILFFVICCLTTFIYSDKSRTVKLPKIANYSLKVNILFMVSIIGLILYTLNIIIISVQNHVSFYDAISLTKVLGGGEHFYNTILRQMYKIVTIISYVSIILLTYNLIEKTYNKKKNKLLLMNIILGMAIVILSSSRADILKQIGVLFFSISLFYVKDKRQIIFILKTLIIVGLLFIVVFFISRNIVKSFEGGYNNLNMYDYICFYIGSPIEVLNIKLQNFMDYRNNVLGYLNFKNIYDYLEQINVLNITDINQFVYIGKFSFGGNVGTIILPFIIDFGYIFGFFLLFIMIIFILMLYKKSIKKCSFWMFLYIYIYSLLTFSFYDALLYQFMSLNTLITIGVLYVLYFFVFKLIIKRSYQTNI